MQLLRFDEAFTEAAAECGLRSFIIMAGAMDGHGVKSEFLSYEGPFGVGYAVCAFTVTGEDEKRKFDDIYQREEQDRLKGISQREDAYVQLARRSLEKYVKTGKRFARPDGLSEDC